MYNNLPNTLLLAAIVLYAIGCGKPASVQHQGMGDFPVSAVVARAKEETVEERLELVATLSAKDEVTLVSELDATVQEISFAEGAAMQQGDVLFRLNEIRAGAQLEAAEADLRLSEMTLSRSTELLEKETISQQEFDEADADFRNKKAALTLARDEYAKTVIRAPLTGIAGEREVSIGQFVQRGETLVSLVSVDPIHVVFDVPERYIGKLRAGLPIQFSTDAFPQDLFEGRVVYLAPSVDSQTRTLRVKGEVSNADARLKPGSFGRLALVLSHRSNAVTLPEASIRFMESQTTVVAVNEAGRSEFRMVQVGERFKGRAEILKGVKSGEYVVVEGFQKMGPGMLVMAAPESAEHGVTPGPLTSSTPQTDSPVEIPPSPSDETSHEAH